MQRSYSVETVVVVALAVLFIGCFGSGSGSSSSADAGDGGDEEIDGGDTDTGSDTGQDTDTSDTEDTDLPPGELGDPCWKEILGTFHPNHGLPNCAKGLNCMYNENESWCSEECSLTGEINISDSKINGWCCGELSNPCSPELYWLPPSMDFSCIPRTARLGESCDQETNWTGDNRRCKPMCDGTELKKETTCAPYDGGTFCTFQCETTDECLFEPTAAFADGCCGEIMTGKWCLIPALCN